VSRRHGGSSSRLSVVTHDVDVTRFEGVSSPPPS
jgi:hypothetical protein